MDDLLYDIGLSLTSSKDEPKRRNFFSRPSVIFSFSLFFITQKLLAIVCDNEIILLLVCGDISHYYGTTMKVLINVFLCLQLSLVTISQLIYYYNHKRQIEPTFLRVFRLINNPADNGVIDQFDIDILNAIRSTLKKLVHFVNYNNKILYMFCVGYNLVPIVLHGYSLIHSLLLCYVGVITFSLAATLVTNITGYQIIHFYILCKYFRMKLKNLNQRIIAKNRPMGFIRILPTFDALYREIDEYNSTYWSKILFSKWLIFGTAIVLLTSDSIVSDIPLALKVMIVYTALFLLFLFLVTIMSAASVNLRAYDSYRSLNSLYILQLNGDTKVSKQINLRNKLKVFIIFMSMDCHYQKNS